jgi:hypothetical protein
VLRVRERIHAVLGNPFGNDAAARVFSAAVSTGSSVVVDALVTVAVPDPVSATLVSVSDPPSSRRHPDTPDQSNPRKERPPSH